MQVDQRFTCCSFVTDIFHFFRIHKWFCKSCTKCCIVRATGPLKSFFWAINGPITAAFWKLPWAAYSCNSKRDWSNKLLFYLHQMGYSPPAEVMAWRNAASFVPSDGSVFSEPSSPTEQFHRRERNWDCLRHSKWVITKLYWNDLRETTWHSSRARDVPIRTASINSGFLLKVTKVRNIRSSRKC